MPKYLRIAGSQRRSGQVWFRFRLRTLLIVPVVLSAVFAWWVTWPQRSAARYVKLIETDPDEADRLYALAGTVSVLRILPQDPPYIETHGRSLTDVLLAGELGN